MHVSYTSSTFRQKQQTKGQNSAKQQAYKIWHTNFLALLSNHILGVVSFHFFWPHTVYIRWNVPGCTIRQTKSLIVVLGMFQFLYCLGLFTRVAKTGGHLWALSSILHHKHYVLK